MVKKLYLHTRINRFVHQLMLYLIMTCNFLVMPLTDLRARKFHEIKFLILFFLEPFGNVYSALSH